MPATSELRDSFRDNSFNTVLWVDNSTSDGSLAEQNNRLELNNGTGSGFGAAISTVSHVFLNSYIFCRMVPAAGVEMDFFLVAADATPINFAIGANGVDTRFTRFNGGTTVIASVTYNSTNHRWFRMRSLGGRVWADIAPDGVDVHHPGNWVALGNEAIDVNPSYDPTTVKPSVNNFYNGVNNIIIHITNFNVVLSQQGRMFDIGIL